MRRRNCEGAERFETKVQQVTAEVAEHAERARHERCASPHSAGDHPEQTSSGECPPAEASRLRDTTTMMGASNGGE
jgi:hypothetical protein